MSAGLSIEVLNRLEKLFVLILKGTTRAEIIKNLSYDKRSLASDISKLKSSGLKLRYLRKSGRYELQWPEKLVPFRFTPEEFFYVYYILKSGKNTEAKSSLKTKLDLALSGETEPVFDCGPAYGIEQNITEEISGLLNSLKTAAVERRKTVFFYRSLSSEPSLRIVHPYSLIHTPISWYLVGFCEERGDFRNFKLARIEQLKVLKDTFKKKEFNLREHIGDAWWLQHAPDSPPLDVKVLFKNEAAQSIREYKFHDSQKLEAVDRGTLVTWRLSYLEEFASWLMQWLENIEIIAPDELKTIIDQRIKKYWHSRR